VHPIIKPTILLAETIAAMASHKEVITADILIVMIITHIPTTVITTMTMITIAIVMMITTQTLHGTTVM
jgi:hypothetical protein